MYNYEGVFILYIQISLLFRVLMSIHFEKFFTETNLRKCTVDPPPKDSDLPPLEGLGPDSNFHKKVFLQILRKMRLSVEFYSVSL